MKNDEYKFIEIDWIKSYQIFFDSFFILVHLGEYE
jgi:hypothetical protein